MSDTKKASRPKGSGREEQDRQPGAVDGQATGPRQRETMSARLKTYDRLVALQSQLLAQLSPEGMIEQQGGKVAQIAAAVLANEELPQLYESRPSLELKLRGIEAAIQHTVEAIGQEVAEQHGRDFGSLNFSLEPDAKPLPRSGEALVEGIANACELEDRREAATKTRADQQARQSAATAEYGRLQFEHEQQGDEPIVASQKAKQEMELPVEDLFAVEGQPRSLQFTGRPLGRAAIDANGQLIAD